MIFGVANYELNGLSLDDCRHLVLHGKSRWLIGRLATLTLVPVDHVLLDGEVFVRETAQGFQRDFRR